MMSLFYKKNPEKVNGLINMNFSCMPAILACFLRCTDVLYSICGKLEHKLLNDTAAIDTINLLKNKVLKMQTRNVLAI